MSANRQQIVAVLFGGRSVEHDVSIVTGQQIMQAFDAARYQVVPVYISREGKWFTGESLRDIKNFKDDAILRRTDLTPVVLSPDVRHHGLILDPLPNGLFAKPRVQRLDVVFPAIHGSHGEDGTLQGLFELADIPYVGFATCASALTNDKYFTKQILRQAGLPVLDDLLIQRSAWRADNDAILQTLRQRFGFPVFVKPATLGSSIGVAKADDEALLRTHLDIASNFDRRVIVEPAVVGGIEINCSVIGYGDEVRASVLEQPLAWSDFLGFEDKYLRGNKGMKSADRLIPAPLSPALSQRIEQLALAAFRAVDGRGIVRIDFLVKPEQDEVYINELNTMPGSLAFYLWQASGLSATQLVDALVNYAQQAHADKRRNTYDYKTNLVSVASVRGTKGTKGAKR